MKAKNLSIILLQSHFLTVTNDEFQLLKIEEKKNSNNFSRFTYIIKIKFE